MSLQTQIEHACKALNITPPPKEALPSTQNLAELRDISAEDSVALIKKLQAATRLPAAPPVDPEAMQIRQQQIEQRQRTHAAIAELGREGVMELIAELGVGGTVETLNLTHGDFRAWLKAEIGNDYIVIAEQMHAERLLYKAESAFDHVPTNKVEESHNANKAKTFVELAGIYDRNRGKAAPKIDINVSQQKTVEVQIFGGMQSDSQLAADKDKASRSIRIAQARVEYGTGDYTNPPAWREWVNGDFEIPETELDDYLMLRQVPQIALAYSDVLEGHATLVDDADVASVETKPDSMVTVNQLLEKSNK